MASALDRKERLLTQLRSMNDEAEKCGPDGRKAQTSDQFRQAYAQVVMQLKQVRTALPPPPSPPPAQPLLPLSRHLAARALGGLPPFNYTVMILQSAY